ncbi:MAG: ubiquinone/menaquinone biosynthesis methyltransferase [Actinobacteria bacterium]|nr:ubiquinone/menaquinone biosynthesis methyltransferase [Actinomycetota bacterium]
MFDRLAPRYDRVNRVISLGLDQRWRRATVAALGLPAGSVVLDLACGTGDLCRALDAAGYHAVGIDLSAGMLRAAHCPSPLVRADTLALPVRDGRVDGVVCGFALRNFVALEPFFAACARALRPGGRLIALDASEPNGAVARMGHALWFRTLVPWIGGRLSGDAAAYRYLPASTAYLPDGAALVDMLARAGFVDVRRTTRTAGAVQILCGTRSSHRGATA